jgi:hypothetical protein
MKFFLVFFISFSALAFDKDLTSINERVPTEFNLMFESMKLQIKKPSEKVRMIGLCKDLNENLGKLAKEHIYLLMKTEVIKGLLEYKFPKVRQFDMNTHLISRLEDDFSRKKPLLNPFTRWIWQSILAELNARKEKGLITGSTFNPNQFDGPKRAEAMRLQKYLQFLFPWIDRFDGLSATEFNELVMDISWLILEKINDRSILFKRFAGAAAGETKTVIINIPQKLLDLKVNDIKSMQSDKAPLTLSEKSKLMKAEAESDMEKVTPLDMSPLSDDLAKELDKKTE